MLNVMYWQNSSWLLFGDITEHFKSSFSFFQFSVLTAQFSACDLPQRGPAARWATGTLSRQLSETQQTLPYFHLNQWQEIYERENHNPRHIFKSRQVELWKEQSHSKASAVLRWSSQSLSLTSHPSLVSIASPQIHSNTFWSEWQGLCCATVSCKLFLCYLHILNTPFWCKKMVLPSIFAVDSSTISVSLPAFSHRMKWFHVIM